MSDIARLFLILILMIVGLSAYFLVIQALFSPRVAKIKAIAPAMTARSFGLGLVNVVFFAVIALVSFSVAENTGPFVRGTLTISALIILGVLAIALSLGLAGMASLVGERLLPDLPAWKQMLWGTVCLALACALPFVGWFLLLPYVGFVGVGSVILGFFPRGRA